MKYKAVIFDLFETLVTEWGHKKYTKNELCSDLGIARSEFDLYWDEREEERYTGALTFEESIEYVCERCGKCADKSVIHNIIDKRVKTKSVCFDHIIPEVFEMLSYLKSNGLKTAIISNCSSEEVTVLKDSALYTSFDEVILSYEVNKKKPDPCIYIEAAQRLGLEPADCIFVGDGGSNELIGAKNVGMTAVQAKWYTDQMPKKRGCIDGMPAADKPMDIIKFI